MTVPFAFLCRGMFDQASVNYDLSDPNVYETWKICRYVALGLVGAAGANFLTQLALYLWDANRVIPKVYKTTPITEEEKENAAKKILEKDAKVETPVESEINATSEENSVKEENSEEKNIETDKIIDNEKTE